MWLHVYSNARHVCQLQEARLICRSEVGQQTALAIDVAPNSRTMSTVNELLECVKRVRKRHRSLLSLHVQPTSVWPVLNH